VFRANPKMFAMHGECLEIESSTRRSLALCRCVEGFDDTGTVFWTAFWVIRETAFQPYDLSIHGSH
jgi:hypothetical protein